MQNYAKNFAGAKKAPAEGSPAEERMDARQTRTPMVKGLANVGQAKVKNLFSGKMGTGKGVSLGTFHGKHNVAHPVSGSTRNVTSSMN